MRISLEKLSQIVLIITCCITAGSVSYSTFFARTAGARPDMAQFDGSNWLGKSVAGSTYPFLGHKVLILGLQENCPACTASMPAFRKLEREANRDYKVLVISHSSTAIRAYLREHDIEPDAIIQPPSGVEIQYTPTTLVANANGAVKFAWVGTLNRDTEAKVQDALRTEK